MTKRLFSAVAITLLITACVTKQIDIRDLFYAIPSPLELSVLFKNAGISYDKNQLLNTEEAYKYDNSSKMALLLGVYGADLSYAGIFKRPQESIRYMAVCKELAEKLSIGEGFDEEMILRIESNIENRDSVILIIASNFLDVDTYFKENKQSENSTLVLIGGWIEGLHLGTTMIRSSESDDKLKEIIKDQYVSLENLILLAEASELKSYSWIVDELKLLLPSFESIQQKEQNEAKISASDEGVLTLSSNNEINYISDEDFNDISTRVSTLRSKLIQL